MVVINAYSKEENFKCVLSSNGFNTCLCILLIIYFLFVNIKYLAKSTKCLLVFRKEYMVKPILKKILCRNRGMFTFERNLSAKLSCKLYASVCHLDLLTARDRCEQELILRILIFLDIMYIVSQKRLVRRVCGGRLNVA